jgi:DNA-binding response OmpR family regulator
MERAQTLKTNNEGSDWQELLEDEGIEVVLVKRTEDLDSIASVDAPNIAVLDLHVLSLADARDCVEKCSHLKLPAIALVPAPRLANLDIRIELDDFVSSPPDADELLIRVKRILWRTRREQGDDIIRAGELIINPSTYEVVLRGRHVNLRYKEYELLRLLATNPGRVYTRDALLSTIWGYDYFGGTRTVDVHIRRLRSKIEDPDHPYIETIWNVGYRFRDEINA